MSVKHNYQWGPGGRLVSQNEWNDTHVDGNGNALPTFLYDSSVRSIGIVGANGYPLIINGGYDIRSYGAKCDGVLLYDANCTNATAIVTSASGAFTQADVGKKCGIWPKTANRQFAKTDVTILSVQSATQITMSGNVAQTYTNGCFLYGTDDYTAIAAANAACAAGGGGVVNFPSGNILSGSKIIIPNGVEWWGRGQWRAPNGCAFAAGTVNYTGTTLFEPNFNAGNFVTLGDSVASLNQGAKIYGMNVDCLENSGSTIAMSGGYGCHVEQMTAIGGNTYAIAGGASATIHDCYAIAANRAYCIQVVGDMRVTDNQIYGCATAKGPIYVNSGASAVNDVLIANNHIYPNGTYYACAGMVILDLAVTQSGGINIQNNQFDTCYGPIVNITLRNSILAKSILISGNSGFTNDSMTNGAQSFLALTTDAGSTVSGLNIVSNTGRGSWQSANGQWLYMMDNTAHSGTAICSNVSNNILVDVLGSGGNYMYSGGTIPAGFTTSNNSVRTVAGTTVTG